MFRVKQNSKIMKRSVPDDVVRAIRDLRIREGKTLEELARIFTVNVRTIGDICLHRTYKDIE